MKTLEKESINQLLEIIIDKPAQRILHFTEGSHTLTKSLNAFCIAHHYSYQLLCTTDICLEKNQQKYGKSTAMSMMKFPLSRPRYVIQGKEYEYIFVTLTLPKEARSDFLEKTYPLIRHAGNIIIFLPKNAHEERYHWLELLEEHLYVATNTIDNMFENYDVIVSKRMHGWGN